MNAAPSNPSSAATTRLGPLLATVTLLVALAGTATLVQAGAPSPSPQATVQALMQYHFSHDMALTPQGVAARGAWLSSGLRRALDGWLARPQRPDEVPDISGDPFTDTQEAPSGYRLDAARQHGTTAVVPVRFQDGPRQRRVRLALVSEGGQWKVDDLLYEDGSRLRQLLK